MSVLKFGFTVMGKSRDEAIEELDAKVREVMEQLTGEPWITVVDDIRKVHLGGLSLDSDNFIYLATREVVFGGPTVLRDHPVWRDGYRPQDKGDFFI
jgi:hypothetical protein